MSVFLKTTGSQSWQFGPLISPAYQHGQQLHQLLRLTQHIEAIKVLKLLLFRDITQPNLNIKTCCTLLQMNSQKNNGKKMLLLIKGLKIDLDMTDTAICILQYSNCRSCSFLIKVKCVTKYPFTKEV